MTSRQTINWTLAAGRTRKRVSRFFDVESGRSIRSSQRQCQVPELVVLRGKIHQGRGTCLDSWRPGASLPAFTRARWCSRSSRLGRRQVAQALFTPSPCEGPPVWVLRSRLLWRHSHGLQNQTGKSACATYGCRFMRRTRSLKRGSERSGSNVGSTLMVANPVSMERSLRFSSR
jgi:hypothetical protein